MEYYKKNKKRFFDIAKWILFIVLISVLIKMVNFDQIKYSILSISISNFTVFIFFLVLSRLLYTYRWQKIILKGLSTHNVSIYYLFRINLLGEFLTLTTPSSLGGEALRVLKLNNINISKIKGTASVVLDRIIGLGSMLIMVTLLLPIFGYDILQNINLFFYRVLFISICGAIIIVIAFIFFRRKVILKHYRTIRTQIHVNVLILLFTILLSIAGHLLFVAGYYVLFQEIYPITFLTTAVLILTSQITKSIPVSIFGIGLGEGAIIGLGRLLEIKAEAIIAIVVIALGSRYLFALLGVILELVHDGWTIINNFKLQKEKNIVP